MSNASKYRKKAVEYEQLKQFDRAIASYARAIEENENANEDVDVALFNKVGDLTLRQGRVTEAVTYYERAVEHYVSNNLFDNAIALCNKILRNAPGRSNVYFTLGRICARKGLRSDATRNFLEYATRMQQEGRVDEGMRALAEVADLMPELTEVHRLVEEHAARAGISLSRKRDTPVRSAAQSPAEPMRSFGLSKDLVFLDIDYDSAKPLRGKTPPPQRSVMVEATNVVVSTMAAAEVAKSALQETLGTGGAGASASGSAAPSAPPPRLEDLMIFDPRNSDPIPEDVDDAIVVDGASILRPYVDPETPVVSLVDLEPTTLDGFAEPTAVQATPLPDVAEVDGASLVVADASAGDSMITARMNAEATLPDQTFDEQVVALDGAHSGLVAALFIEPPVTSHAHAHANAHALDGLDGEIANGEIVGAGATPASAANQNVGESGVAGVVDHSSEPAHDAGNSLVYIVPEITAPVVADAVNDVWQGVSSATSQSDVVQAGAVQSATPESVTPRSATRPSVTPPSVTPLSVTPQSVTSQSGGQSSVTPQSAPAQEAFARVTPAHSTPADASVSEATPASVNSSHETSAHATPAHEIHTHQTLTREPFTHEPLAAELLADEPLAPEPLAPELLSDEPLARDTLAPATPTGQQFLSHAFVREEIIHDEPAHDRDELPHEDRAERSVVSDKVTATPVAPLAGLDSDAFIPTEREISGIDAIGTVEQQFSGPVATENPDGFSADEVPPTIADIAAPEPIGELLIEDIETTAAQAHAEANADADVLPSLDFDAMLAMTQPRLAAIPDIAADTLETGPNAIIATPIGDATWNSDALANALLTDALLDDALLADDMSSRSFVEDVMSANAGLVDAFELPDALPPLVFIDVASEHTSLAAALTEPSAVDADSLEAVSLDAAALRGPALDANASDAEVVNANLANGEALANTSLSAVPLDAIPALDVIKPVTLIDLDPIVFEAFEPIASQVAQPNALDEFADFSVNETAFIELIDDETSLPSHGELVFLDVTDDAAQHQNVSGIDLVDDTTTDGSDGNGATDIVAAGIMSADTVATVSLAGETVTDSVSNSVTNNVSNNVSNNVTNDVTNDVALDRDAFANYGDDLVDVEIVDGSSDERHLRQRTFVENDVVDADVFIGADDVVDENHLVDARDVGNDLLQNNVVADDVVRAHVIPVDVLADDVVDDDLGDLFGDTGMHVAVAAAEATIVASSRCAELQSASDADPENFVLRRRLAEALFEAGNRDAAISELGAALAGAELRGLLANAADIADELVRVNGDDVAHHQKRLELAIRLGDQNRLRDAYLDLADTLVRRGEDLRAKAVYARVLEIDPYDDRARTALGDAAPPAPAQPLSGPSDEGHVNLADWLRDDDEPASTRLRMREPDVTGDEQDDFNSLLRHFKEGVARSLGEDDYESHYDLGVAYKEMGLLDDAIGEFQMALRSRNNRLAAYEALGQCFLEQESYKVAVTVLSRALHEPGVQDEQRVGILYLLGYSCEVLQRFDEARSYFQRVYATDIHFRDVGQRLADLERTVR